MILLYLTILKYFFYCFSGSKIRGAVAHIPFDEFHRHSSQVIQHAVFDRQPDGSLAQSLRFSANNLVSP